MMRVITCIICELSIARSDMINHIAEDLNYYRYQCTSCEFKTAYSHSIVEHELDTGHKPAKENTNRYLDRLCSIVYKDCVLRDKNGIDAVFEPATSATGLSTHEELITQATSSKNLHMPTIVSDVHRRSTATSSNTGIDAAESDDEPAIVCEKNKSDKVNTVYDVEDSDDMVENNTSTVPNASTNETTIVNASNNLQSSRKQRCKKKSPGKMPRRQTQEKHKIHEEKNSKVPEADVTSYESLVRANCMDMTMEDALRGTVNPIQTCLKCSVEVPNYYRSHKEHVQKMHEDECNVAGVEDVSSLISKCILRCFPNAKALNDYQCTMCSHEVRSSSGRRHHVDRNHLYMCFTCPSRECSATFSQMESLMQHLKALHDAGDSLTGEERLMLKHTKDTHNSKLREMIGRSFPYPVPSIGVTDQILARSTVITANREMEANDALTDLPPPTNTASTVSEAPKNGSASCGVECDSPESVANRISTVSKTGVNLRIYKKEINIKEEENNENEKKSKKRKKFDNSSSSSESENETRAQRTLKISRLVDEINLREAQRRKREGVFCFNRQLPIHKRTVPPSGNGSSSSLSSTSTDCDAPIYSVPRRAPPSALNDRAKYGALKEMAEATGAVNNLKSTTETKMNTKTLKQNDSNNQKIRSSANLRKSPSTSTLRCRLSRPRETNSDRSHYERSPSSRRRIGRRSVSRERLHASEKHCNSVNYESMNSRSRKPLSHNRGLTPYRPFNGSNIYGKFRPAIPSGFAPGELRNTHPSDANAPPNMPQTSAVKTVTPAINTATLKPMKLERY